MKKQGKKIIMLLKQNVRTKVIILSLALGIVLSLLGYSYALFTISQEKSNTFHIVIGNLNYKITSDVLDSTMKVKVPSYTPLSFEVTIESLNPIDSKYQLYYEGTLPPGVMIRYVEGSGTPEGEIGVTGKTQKVTIVIENNSSSDYTATFGVQGGFTKHDFVLASDKTAITELFSLDKEYVYTGSYQTFTVPVSGYYRLEAWGAQGGGGRVSLDNPSIETYPGRGAYTSGVIYLEAGTILYVYVGGKGELDSLTSTTNIADSFAWNNGGYNGGGSTYSRGGSSGGGATDFALVFSEVTLNNHHIYIRSEESYRSRIMVAAGGGGASRHGIERYTNSDTLSQTMGGFGGAYIGRSGYSTFGYRTCIRSDRGCPSQGGTQTSGGTSYRNSDNEVVASKNIVGSFGYGGYGYGRDFAIYYGYASGGGGGYYGGGGTYGPEGAGGGSSFVSGASGVNALANKNATTHTNNSIHYSGYYFIDTQMQSNVWEGNGKAQVTYMGKEYTKKTTKLNQVRYIKDCLNRTTNTSNGTNVWVELQAIKNGVNVALNKTITGTGTATAGRPYTNLVNGDISLNYLGGTYDTGSHCVTVDLGQAYDLDEIAVWLYYGDDRIYQDHTLSVSSDNANWITLVDHKKEYPSTDGIHVNAYHTVTSEVVKGGMLAFDLQGDSVFLSPMAEDRFVYAGVNIYDEEGNLWKTLSATETEFSLQGKTKVVLRPRWTGKDKILLLLDSDIVPSFQLGNKDGATITYNLDSTRNYFYLSSSSTLNARADVYTTSSYPLTDFSTLFYRVSSPYNANITTSVGVSASPSYWLHAEPDKNTFLIPAKSTVTGNVDLTRLNPGNYYIGSQLLTGGQSANLDVLELTLKGTTYE